MKKKLIYTLTGLALTAIVAGNINAVFADDMDVSVNEQDIIESNIQTLEIEEEGVTVKDSFYVSGDINNISVNDSIITINAGGTYKFTGTLEDGQIIVNSEDEKKVNIVLNGVNISCSNSAPIYIKNADKTTITLNEGTENYITDGISYVYEDGNSDEPDAAIFSKDDLTINGDGSLIVKSNYKNGIVGKDDVKIKSGNIKIDAVNNGIKGKDSITVSGGNITINAGNDGMKSTNDSNTEKGYILIESGTFNITSAEDAIQAENYVNILDGDFTIVSGGGNEMNKDGHEDFGPGGPGGMGGEFTPPQMEGDQSSFGGNQGNSNGSTSTDEDSVSSKGIKAVNKITIDGGTFNIDSCDDAIHSNGSVVINNGDINIKAGDDGIHADYTVDINGGNIDISKSYEALEAGVITINDGNIYLIASDDGVNASGKTESNVFYINGGYTVVNANGDGLDSNGSISMTDGTVIVNGPTQNNNGALDYDETFKMDGGFLIAAGSVGMVQTVSENSAQNCVNITLKSQGAGTLVHIENEDKEDILTFAPSKEFSSVVVCSPRLQKGSDYKVYVGGSYNGEEKDGLYSNGVYSAGEEIGNFTVSSIISSVTQEGASSGMMGGGPGGMPGQGGMPGPGGMPGFEDVDKTSLQELYDSHKDDKQGKYTTTTWNVFIAALNNAQSILENNFATKNNVDSAYNMLTCARSNLKTSSSSSSHSHSSSSSNKSNTSSITEVINKYNFVERLNGTVDNVQCITTEGGKNAKVIKVKFNDNNAVLVVSEQTDKVTMPIDENQNVYVYIKDLDDYMIVSNEVSDGKITFEAEGEEEYIIASQDVIPTNVNKGWNKKDNYWYMIKDNGTLATGWYKDYDGKWYHLNSQGIMNTGWVKTNDKWYYLEESGAMVTGWKKDNEKWYYLNLDGSMCCNTYIDGYYLGSDGAWIK